MLYTYTVNILYSIFYILFSWSFVPGEGILFPPFLWPPHTKVYEFLYIILHWRKFSKSQKNSAPGSLVGVDSTWGVVWATCFDPRRGIVLQGFPTTTTDHQTSLNLATRDSGGGISFGMCNSVLGVGWCVCVEACIILSIWTWTTRIKMLHKVSIYYNVQITCKSILQDLGCSVCRGK